MSTTEMQPGFYNMDCMLAMKEFPDKFVSFSNS